MKESSCPLGTRESTCTRQQSHTQFWESNICHDPSTYADSIFWRKIYLRPATCSVLISLLEELRPMSTLKLSNTDCTVEGKFNWKGAVVNCGVLAEEKNGSFGPTIKGGWPRLWIQHVEESFTSGSSFLGSIISFFIGPLDATVWGMRWWSSRKLHSQLIGELG